MTAYEAGCSDAAEKLSLTKEAFLPFLGRMAASGAARFAASGGLRGAATRLGGAMAQNKGLVAMNTGLGAMSNWDPKNPMKSVAGGAMGAVTAPFGMKGFMANTAGNMLMNSGG